MRTIPILVLMAAMFTGAEAVGASRGEIKQGSRPAAEM
jgi:hypothetical protein